MPKGQRIKPEQIVMLLRQVEVFYCQWKNSSSSV
jgi:hypothetical protein